MDSRQDPTHQTILHRKEDDETLFLSAIGAGSAAMLSYGLLPFPILSTLAWCWIPVFTVAAWVFAVLTARKPQGPGSGPRYVLLATAAAAAPTILGLLLVVWRAGAWSAG
jgi:hypothetical protein